MSMKIKCPFCDQHYEIDSSHIGQEAQCSSCGQDFFIDKKDVYDVPQAQPEMQIPHEPEPMTPAPPPIPVVASNTTVSVQQQSAPAMKPLTCEMCGSTNILKQEGIFVCQSCSTKYTVEEAKKMMIAGTVNVAGTVKVDVSEKLKNLYVLARRAKDEENAENASKYYDLILQEDPRSWEASFYLAYYKAMSCKTDASSSASYSLEQCLISVIELVFSSEQDISRQQAILTELSARSTNFAVMAAQAAESFLRSMDEEFRSPYIKDYIANIYSSANICYTIGNILEQRPEFGELSVNSWHYGIQIHSGLLYSNDHAHDRQIIAEYVAKIKRFDPTYIPPNTKPVPVVQTQTGHYKPDNEIGCLGTGIGIILFFVIVIAALLFIAYLDLFKF